MDATKSRHKARGLLDVIATVATIAVALTVIWAVFDQRSGQSSKQTSKSEDRPARVQPAAPTEPISVTNRPSMGSSTARVTVVEFSDFQCPFCTVFAKNTLPRFIREFVDSGKARLVFWHFPLEQIHSNAMPAAIASECADQQGRFWQMHDLLFLDRKRLDPSSLRLAASTVGLDLEGFDRCRASGTPARVVAMLDAGNRLSITGTPTFFVGWTLPDGNVQVKERFSGAIPYDEFATLVSGVLKTELKGGPKQWP